MSQHLRSQVEEDKEGAAVNLQSTRVREVFKYLPDWAPKTEDASAQDPILSPDVTLNAFAQLVALRMGVDRSMISFLDGEEQYVLAEATKTSPLQRGRLDKVGDELMTGVRTIASGQGLCYQALAQVPVDGILIVENIHESKDFCLRPFAQSAPDVKFYAACPIVINDEKVGILCVIDHNARETVTTEEVSFLCDVASSVAQHLETMRMKRTRDRTVDIVAALDAVMRPGHKIRSSRASLKKTNARVFGQPIKNSQDVVGKGHDPRQEESIEPNVEFRSPAPPGSSSNFLEYAGSLLVDGFNADGVVFYDAGSRIYTAGISRRDTDYSTSSSGFPTTPQELIVPGHKGEILQAIDSPACKILAFSSSKDLFDDSNPIGNLQEHNLRDLLEMFPTGKVLHVGDAGLSVDKSIAEPLRQISPEPGHIRADQCLIEAMPNAQNIIFFPLWDHCRERWYAGGFLYSNDAKRLVFTEEDLNFLRAFALVLTGELANRDRERSHIQKETFISMISHELRTPLHGILSNVDLMKDVGLSTFQSTLLDTISACGHSLMDIINHLIDRSTMASTEDNYKKHYRLSEKHRQAPLKRETSYDKLEAVDLVVLTEEVINALAIEMHLRAEVRQGYETALQSSSSSEAQDLLPSYAVIIYDIYPQYDWSVRVRKGAFRRLLANLTSNAIKFTREGTIKISLQRQEPTDSNLSCLVNLDIEDTGEGISDDFLKHHLFQQFKQENARTIGSGLGLHIVKSMVDELQGKIDIRSSKGFGTSVSISFPCELTTWNGNQDLGSPLDYADPVLQQVKSEGHRLTAYFVSSDEDQRPWHKRVALDHSKESISRICRNWFGIKIEASTGLKAGPGIINFVDESFLDSRPFSEILVDMARDLEWNESGKIFTSPILIVGTINFTAALQSQSSFKAKNMFSITNP